MHFFFHVMEELYTCGNNVNDGNIVATFPNTKNIFVRIVHWDRAIAHTFQYSLLKSFLESIKNRQKSALSQILRTVVNLANQPYFQQILADFLSGNR